MKNINKYMSADSITGDSVKLSSVSGPSVYFLIKESEIVYVGKSKAFHSRISQHVNDKKKDFDSFKIVPCSTDEMDLLEMFFINHYKPTYNTQSLLDGDTFKSIIKFRK